jgi:predicted nuclease of restriction endonuclease-like (RecB) superfamily
MSQLQTNYIKVLDALKDKIRHARLKVAVTANIELIQLHWEIGKTILEQQKKDGWGGKTIDKLAIDLRTEFPDFQGLSVRNLKYMRAFAEAYPTFFSIVQPTVAQLEDGKNSGTLFVQPSVAQIPWTHHTIILDKAKTLEERLFYMEKTLQNGWSKAILSLQIESELYKRQGNAITNFKATLTSPQSDLANETLKNPYVFDFLSFSEEIKERELEKALIQHLNKFMRELGRGFAFVGNQKNVNVDGDDYFLDLLFYNYHLHCFVIFELKVGNFKPEYAGKLNFYVNTINEQLKGETDNPTIGVLLCKTPNETVVKYSLQNIKAPIGVSDYRLANALPKQIKTEMPTIEELEQELEKEIEELKKPVDKKFDRLKEMISGLKQPKVKEKRSPKTSERIFTKIILPLRDEIKKALAKISKEFSETEIMVWTDNQGHKTDSEAQAHGKKYKEFNEYRIEIRLRGFKPAGTKAFDVWKDLCITMNSYNYTIGLGRHQQQNILPEKLYHELPDKKEFEEIVEKCTKNILDDITQQIERIQKEKK